MFITLDVISVGSIPISLLVQDYVSACLFKVSATGSSDAVRQVRCFPDFRLGCRSGSVRSTVYCVSFLLGLFSKNTSQVSKLAQMTPNLF
jgi:hypothetical protein